MKSKKKPCALKLRSEKIISSWASKKSLILSLVLNQITALFLHNMNDIGSHLANHFISLFSTSSPELSGLEDLFEPIISSFENDLLCLIPDEHEIWRAVSELGSEKSPGPDGVTRLFYKLFWKIVKVNVIRFVQSFFRNAHLLRSFNHTHLVLIPKINNPTKVSQYRPAFLQGRSIHDNFILVHQWLRTLLCIPCPCFLFLLPKSFLHDINSSLRKLWWSYHR